MRSTTQGNWAFSVVKVDNIYEIDFKYEIKPHSRTPIVCCTILGPKKRIKLGQCNPLRAY